VDDSGDGIAGGGGGPSCIDAALAWEVHLDDAYASATVFLWEAYYAHALHGDMGSFSF